MPGEPAPQDSLTAREVHAHACDTGDVRTTVEIKPEYRARLLELAATRGEKGFSGVLNEALELYLQSQSSRTDAVRKALALKGTFTSAEAETLRAETRKLRAHWR
jgi:predicted transcriptional regulator